MYTINSKTTICIGALLGLLCLGSIPAMVAADSVPIRYQLRPAVDFPVIAMSVTTWLGLSILGAAQGGVVCDERCRLDDLNPIDRSVPGTRIAWMRPMADVSLTAILLSSAIVPFLGRESGSAAQVFTELTIVLETLAVTGALTAIVKHAAHRPRPYMYDPSTPRDYRRNDGQDYHSFFSGHTSIAFAAAASFSRMFAVIRPDSRLRWLVYVTSFSLAASTALFRVGSGDHFWTDLVTAAVVGTSIGFALPAVHESNDSRSVSRMGITPGSVFFRVSF